MTFFSPARLSAQSPPFGCNVVTGVPPIVRAEGVTDLVGDVVLRCTGGAPTATGIQVPQANIQVFLNTNITSRILGDIFSEALLLVDEPAPENQRPCLSGPCGLTGVGPAGIRYNLPGPSTIPNVFQGQQAGVNSVIWAGVPIDPPASGLIRTIRITNVRANATQIGSSTTLVPSQVVMSISISSASIPLTSAQQVVAFVTPGLSFSFASIDETGNVVESAPGSVTQLLPCKTSGQLVARFRESFASSFKTRGTTASGTPYSPDSSPPPIPQPIPGQTYFSETGFYNPALPSTNGLNRAGLADQGTRLMLRFSNLPSGVSVFVDLYERSASPSRARLVSTDRNGAGAFTPMPSEGAQLSVVDGSAMAVWEVLSSNPTLIETLDFTITVSYGTGIAGTVSAGGSFAPTSVTAMASSDVPIPRFGAGTLRPAFAISECRFSILFPFVSNQNGFDTSLVIANTTLDPLGSVPQSGDCRLYFYGTTGAGGSSPSPQTSTAVPAGGQLIWTLSTGGNYGISPTPNFQGYVIASCGFPLMHGFARIGSRNGTSANDVAYLGLILDQQLPLESRRSQQFGESLTH